MYYSSLGILALAVNFIINFRIFRTVGDKNSPAAKKRYTGFLIWLNVYFITDALWGILYEMQQISLCYADTVLFFLSIGFSVFSWTRFVVVYVDKKSIIGRFIVYAGWFILFSKVAVVTINAFYPILFSFDEQNVLIPGAARYVMLIAHIVLFMATTVFAFVSAKKSSGETRLHDFCVGFSGIIMAVFIVFQVLYPLHPFYSAGCMLAICIIRTFVAENELKSFSEKLGSVERLAFIDSLTGVKNLNAYAESTQKNDGRILSGELTEFAVVVFDLNGLKIINDTKGHHEGDKYIVSACRMICDAFSHSPVYRIGGDEFTVFLEGRDYADRHEITAEFSKLIEDNKRKGKVVISFGMAEFNPETDDDCITVFKRADHRMYEHKKALKAE